MHLLVVFLVVAAVVCAVAAAAGSPSRIGWGWLAVGCVAGAMLVPAVAGL